MHHLYGLGSVISFELCPHLIDYYVSNVGELASPGGSLSPVDGRSPLWGIRVTLWKNLKIRDMFDVLSRTAVRPALTI